MQKRLGIMLMNSKILLQIKSKLKKYLSNKDIIDIILFGSVVKGKVAPSDIDVAVISDEKVDINIDGFHVINLKLENFIVNPSTIVMTLFREGYSLRKNKSFSEIYGFSSRVLFNYELKTMNPSDKVKIVNVLRGKKGKNGLVVENKGRWLANQVFFVPIGNSDIIEKFLINFKIKFEKYYVLMH